MTTNLTVATTPSEIARNNEVVLENARAWASRGHAVRVQVIPPPGQRPCSICKHLAGTYMLNALPPAPNPACERAEGCVQVYHLILLV